MALRYYFDTHIAKAVAVQLRARGIDVVRCEEVDMADASDEAHLIYATEHSLIMVSQDDDFLALHNQWQSARREHTGIMKISPDLQGTGQIGHLVKELLFYSESDDAGAIDYQTEIYNHRLYL